MKRSVTKNYKLKPNQIKQMVPDMGFAFVTDMIAVEGKRVDYMARQQTDREGDSGWIFYSGGETQEYMNDSNNISLFGVNEVANYDPEIIRFLTYPPGTEIARNSHGRLEVITKEVKGPDVIFLSPVDPGAIEIGNNWGFNINSRMLKRIDQGSLVIWRPGLTIWLNSYDTNNVSIEERLNNIKTTASPNKSDYLETQEGELYKIRYSLKEVINGQEQYAVYLFALVAHQELHITLYFDAVEDLNEIEQIWKTIHHFKVG